MILTAIQSVWSLVMRHRFTIWDIAVLLAVTGLLSLLAVQHDWLISIGIGEQTAGEVEFVEGALIIAVLAGLAYVSFRRLKQQTREVSQRLAAEQEVRVLAFHDPLTGLANRRQFDELVAQAIASPPGADRSHAVMLIDLNGFKAINDTFGHPVGDDVLREVGRRLESTVRESGDHVARLGGDEFGVVAAQIFGVEDASNIALRIIDSLEKPISTEKADHRLGAGIGIALFPQDGGTGAEIIRRADVALYRAKLAKKSGHRFFEEGMDEQIKERSLIERELRNAIAESTIEPFYQPIVDLGSNQIIGFEALARWHHHTLGEIAPDRFIPIAEATGLISALGDHLLSQACRDALTWPADTTLSFNVSPVQLHDPSFGLKVLSILGDTGLRPSRLELEITENTLVKDLEAADNILGSLRSVGVRIALDDFGTGYSSLYHLRRFKFDRIKIDRSFVESMDQGESQAIVNALIGLGHGLGVNITAEGIEDRAQLEALVANGCDQGQGFLYSQAVRRDQVQALLNFKKAHDAK